LIFAICSGASRCAIFRLRMGTGALRRVPARQPASGLPRGIGFHRAATCQELTQHRVIHPGAGEKPGPNIPALRRIRAQRPRPHMGGRALRTLARPRLATDWLRQPSARCRFDAIPITHLHTATVEAHTDNLGARAALKGRTARCAANTPAAVSAPTCADTSGPRPTTPSRAQAHQSIIKQYIDGQPRPLRTPGPRASTGRMGLLRTMVPGLRPRKSRSSQPAGVGNQLTQAVIGAAGQRVEVPPAQVQ